MSETTFSTTAFTQSTPAFSKQSLPRTLQFNYNQESLEYNSFPLNHTSSQPESIPNLNNTQYRNPVININKIIQFWELKYTGKLDADDFLDGSIGRIGLHLV